jgi:hypothetical protein
VEAYKFVFVNEICMLASKDAAMLFLKYVWTIHKLDFVSLALLQLARTKYDMNRHQFE